MKKRILGIFLAVCIVMTMVPTLAFSVAAASTTVYVSSNGNDYNSGTYNSPYATLSKAYSMVTDGGTIYVMSDLTVSSQLTFSTNKTVTIRTTDVDGTGSAYTGNAVTVKRSSTTLFEPFTITAGTVTFTNITLDGNTTGTENGKPAPWLDKTGASFMRVDGTSTVVLGSGATVQNISAQDEQATPYFTSGLGGIVVASKLYIKEGSRITNIAAAYGAIRVYPVATTNSVAYVEMSGGIIEYCDSFGQSFQEGSTIYIFQAGANKQANFKMTGGSIENCGLRSYDRCYGTVYLHPQNTTASSFIMTGGTIKNNKSGTVGGIYIANGNVQMSGDAQVFDNVDASGNKANVLLQSGQTISLTGALSDKANIGISAQYMPTTGQADVALGVSGNGYTIQSGDARAFSSDKATTAGILLKNSQIVMSAAAKATDFKVSGKVSDYVGGTNTLSGITVSLYDAADTTFARPLASAVTDASGIYSIPATVKAGSYVAHIAEKSNAYASASANVTITTADVSGVNFTLVKSVKANVVLNKPIFNNDKSGYSFKSATINNFTGVKSITFSITKGTTVKYVPTFLTPTSKLESIDGDTRTATYVFESGITVSQAEEFIRGMVFNYVAGADITITVDNNLNKLPDGAKITEYNDHYYLYVPSSLISWTNAYNQAKTYIYMGLKGYLATVTSQEEDNILTNISKTSAWSAGTRYLAGSNIKLADLSSVSVSSYLANYYYWACGPEAGTIYYNSISPTATPGAGYTGYNGAYNNWGANFAQPDAATSGEVCMQVNWPSDRNANGQMRWNDLPNAGLPSESLVNGYFVEFSNYAGGADSTYATDQTAVGTYNLATDGGVEEVATVTLNSPVYTSGNQSVFSFDNATITNISKTYTLTIKLDNYTNVLSKPSAPVPSNELSNIAGAINTITYQFESGITLTEAQSFLRGIKFRYGGLRNSSTTNVSVTVDGNKTNLPTGANITEFNGHYYMYVNDYLSWTDAYNKAKTYNYMGLIGYLATITSAGEDKVLDNISMNGAWSAGTRHTGTYDLATAPNGTPVNNPYFIWACGPEAGTKYYYNNTTPVNGAYNGFFDTNEPNGFINYANAECCMQVHYKANSSSPITWNDLSDRIYIGGTEPGVGYFVEFSDYDGGRVDGFTQSANGKSVVQIIVEKGDVFNTVKNGGTYYVDTVLKAFDRNITGITVNGASFTNGGKLAGNLNTTYTIVATDLEGNTATMTVTMKTIASLSAPISTLTVNNVQMSHKDSILTVKAALLAIDTTDASAAQKTEIANAVQNCKNLYFALFNATATTTNGTNGWYKNGIGDITLTAPEGFVISASSSGAWTSSITADKIDGANKTVAYYLKETSTGDISGAKTFSYKVDTVAPTGTITIKSNAFKSFINTISFGLFFKNTVDVSISATDTMSTPVTIVYQKVASRTSYNENGTWISGSSFSVTANEKFFVYAKLTDNAGNVTIINSDGVVVYTDSTQGSANVSFTKKSTADASATVTLNGNTIKDISNGSVTLVSGTDYTVSGSTITFKASYLDSLAVDTYTLTVSYNPMGETYQSKTDNQAPATTSLTLSVKARNLSGEVGSDASASIIITPDTMVHSGNAFNPTVIVKDGAITLVKDTDYTVSWSSDMIGVGEKTLTVTFKGNYSGTVTKKATITNASITDTTNKAQSATYNNTVQTIVAPEGTTVNNQTVTVKYSVDGGLTYTVTSAPSFTTAGNYTVYYQLSAPNHNAVTGQILFTVNAATDNAISGLALNGWTYGEAAKAPTATAKCGTISYTYSDSENGTYTATVPAKAGTYFVKASVAATANYNACEAKTSFIISAKAVENNDITVSGVNEYYLFTGSAITPEPTVSVGETILVKDTDYTVGYESNTAIGTNAKVIVTLRGNYSGSAQKVFAIRYGTATEDEIKNMITLPEFNSNGWYKEDIVVSGKSGFTLSTTPTGSFGNSLTISNESAKTGTAYTFYIKASDGSVYERTLTYKLDKTVPTDAQVQYNTNGFRSFLNTITFGVFFKETVNVTAKAIDSLSGIESYQYYATDNAVTDFSSVIWSNSLRITPNSKKIVYVKATDIAGNFVIVNEGVVVYTDSTQNTSDISFTRTSTSDVTAKVNLNGNTVKEIKNGSAVLVKGTDYSETSGAITFKASYLDKLAVGTYTLTVSYNPMGESYVLGAENQAPATTTITLSVKAKNLSDTGGTSTAIITVTPDSHTYNGKAFAPTVTVKDGTNELIAGTDYTAGWTADMVNAGEKTLTVTFQGIYSGTATKNVTIANASITDTTSKTQSATYNGSEKTITAPAGTTVSAQALTVKYSADGKVYDVTSAPSFTTAGNYTVYYQLSAPNHNAVTGQILFTVNAATDNAISGLALNGWTYGEAAKAPTATAKYGTISYTYSDSVNGTYTATVPAKAGTYFVKASVAATANYNACEAKTSFTVSAKTVGNNDISVSGVNEYYLFTGSAITPEPTVSVGETILVKDTDYTVEYENNTAIGTNAKVTVTLIGNYSGTAQKVFAIRYGTATEDEIKNMITLPEFNSNGWYNKDIVISAVGDWMLCKTPTGTFDKTLTISDESGKTGTDYSFYIKATNGSVYERVLNYKLDKAAPEGSVAVQKNGINRFRTVTFGLLFNDDADVTVISNDALSGIARVDVYKADEKLTEQELGEVQWTAYTAAIHETAKDTQHFIYYARIADNAGNEVIVNSDGVIFDTTAPVISGITDKETYYTSQKVTVTDTSLDTVTVNDKDFTSGNAISGNANVTYQIVATDRAGNVTTYTVTMKPISDLSDPLDKITDDVKPDDQKDIEEIKKKAEAVDTTNATPDEKKDLQDIIDKCNRLLKKIKEIQNDTHSPQTGDTNHMQLWMALFFVSGGALTMFGIRKKRRFTSK